MMAKEYSVNQVINRGEPTSLNPYHTHFLLVDDGSRGKYGAEIKFRAKMEASLAKNLGMDWLMINNIFSKYLKNRYLYP